MASQLNSRPCIRRLHQRGGQAPVLRDIESVRLDDQRLPVSVGPKIAQSQERFLDLQRITFEVEIGNPRVQWSVELRELQPAVERLEKMLQELFGRAVDDLPFPESIWYGIGLELQDDEATVGHTPSNREISLWIQVRSVRSCGTSTSMIWACEIRWAIQSRQRSPATISSQMITSRRSVRPSRICLIRLAAPF